MNVFETKRLLDERDRHSTRATWSLPIAFIGIVIAPAAAAGLPSGHPFLAVTFCLSTYGGFAAFGVLVHHAAAFDRLTRTLSNWPQRHRKL